MTNNLKTVLKQTRNWEPSSPKTLTLKTDFENLLAFMQLDSDWIVYLSTTMFEDTMKRGISLNTRA